MSYDTSMFVELHEEDFMEREIANLKIYINATWIYVVVNLKTNPLGAMTQRSELKNRTRKVATTYRVHS